MLKRDQIRSEQDSASSITANLWSKKFEDNVTFVQTFVGQHFSERNMFTKTAPVESSRLKGGINEIPEKKDLSFLTFESVKFNFFSVKRSPQNSQVLMTETTVCS